MAGQLRALLGALWLRSWPRTPRRSWHCTVGVKSAPPFISMSRAVRSHFAHAFYAYGVTEGRHAQNASNLTPHGVPKTQRGDAVRQVERCGVTDKQLKPMTYIRDLERELKALLEAGDEAKVIRFVKEKALESYRNGLDATALRVDQAAEKLEQSVRAS